MSAAKRSPVYCSRRVLGYLGIATIHSEFKASVFEFRLTSINVGDGWANG